MTNVMVSDFADFSIVNVLFQATFPLIRVCFFDFFNRFFFSNPFQTIHSSECTVLMYIINMNERGFVWSRSTYNSAILHLKRNFVVVSVTV